MTWQLAANEVYTDPGPIMRGIFLDEGWSLTPAGCTFSISPTNVTVGPAASSGSVTLTTQTGCAWTASSTNTGIATITSAASGSGSATINYNVMANPAVGPRSVSLMIGGQTFAITQNGTGPTMTLDRTTLVFAAVNNGGSFTAQTAGQVVRMTQSGAGTVSWTASSNAPWLVVAPTSGTGTATLTVSTQFVPGLAATQSGSITINLTGAGNTAGPISVTLNSIPPGSVQPPFGSFDTPMNGVNGVAGSIAVTGWALDRVQVTRVTVCRDAFGSEVAPVDPNCAGRALIYIGDAVFIDGARTDVQALNPTLPLNSRAGWGYLMLTNFLPNLGNGTFNLRAFAFDPEGLTTALGMKTITCANASSPAPFGAIDLPGQGAVVSGAAYGNVGWVLAPGPNFADPPDGGTVNVFVDGTIVGSPGAWNARSDLTALFPAAQYPGISKALGIFGLDTTTLTNGVHTIFWIVTGTGGSGTSGIGSRFFTVSNGSDLLNQSAGPSSSRAATVIAARSTLEIPPAASSHIVSGQQTLASEIAAAPLDLQAVQGRRGFDLQLPLRTYTPSSGAVDVQAEELDRIELHLSSGGRHQYTGYLETAGGLGPLPVGSSLDPSTGTFTWMPGVGFYGTYALTFVRWSGGTAVARQDVRITLNAKSSNRVGPQTVIDAPTSGASVGSPFFVGGWAADLDSAVDSGVSTIHVWAYPVDAKGNHLDPIFIGPAFYGGARSDVAAIYGDRFAASGYGIIVNGLPPGRYDIAVFAYSTVLNTFTPAKVVRVTVR
ncbi:MAG TPA: BACON domain-containing carbohydrate-binding protein [Vicinamibacterales bacterium]